jgi:hypothetical protein
MKLTESLDLHKTEFEARAGGYFQDMVSNCMEELA